MIHASKLPVVMSNTDDSGKPKLFSLKFRKASTGELIEANDVYMSSYYHRNGTINIVFPSKETRKIKLCSIIEFNNKEVFL